VNISISRSREPSYRYGSVGGDTYACLSRPILVGICADRGGQHASDWNCNIGSMRQHCRFSCCDRHSIILSGRQPFGERRSVGPCVYRKPRFAHIGGAARRSVESTFCDENGGLPRRRHKRRLKVDGKLCSWHRMFNSTKGRKNASPRYSATTICRFTLEKTKFVLLDIAPPRCKPMILKVPSKALEREFFGGTSHHQVHIYVPLDRIPDNPRFPFLDYIV
jgi:hypothetical protein